MRKPFYVLAIALLLNITIAAANENPETPWPVEERCVAEPIQAPDAQTYPGRLLMAGYAGIHALQADWDAPHVVAFFHPDRLGKPLQGGQLSPDGKWYALPIGETYIEPSLNQMTTTNGLRVYSTVNDTELNFDLSEYDHLLDYSRADYYGTAWTYEAVRWVNDTSLIIGSFLFRPFENEVEASSITVAEARFADFELAPDWTRVYGFIIYGEIGKGIFDPATPDEPITHLDANAVAWLHDSSGFIADQSNQTETQLSLYDRDGNFVERQFTADGGHIDIRRTIAGRNELGWSADDQYFAFDYASAGSYENHLILLDQANRIAIDTCLDPVSQPIWSPDSTQIALLLDAPENLRVVILDLETWTAYDVARHSGVEGALQPDMIAWLDER